MFQQTVKKLYGYADVTVEKAQKLGVQNCERDTQKVVDVLGVNMLE